MYQSHQFALYGAFPISEQSGATAVYEVPQEPTTPRSQSSSDSQPWSERSGGFSTPVAQSAAETESTATKEKRRPHRTACYRCEVCEKTFTRPSALQTHSHSHTGERPYKCNYPDCGRDFSVLSNARRHQKTHTKKEKGRQAKAQDRARKLQKLMEDVGTTSHPHAQDYHIQVATPPISPLHSMPSTSNLNQLSHAGSLDLLSSSSYPVNVHPPYPPPTIPNYSQQYLTQSRYYVYPPIAQTSMTRLETPVPPMPFVEYPMSFGRFHSGESHRESL